MSADAARLIVDLWSLLSGAATLVGLINDGSTHAALMSKLDGLTSAIEGSLGISEDRLREILDDYPQGGSVREQADYVLACVASPDGVSSPLEATGEHVRRLTEVLATDIAAIRGHFDALAASSEEHVFLDAASSMRFCQIMYSSAFGCLGAIPPQELFVEPALTIEGAIDGTPITASSAYDSVALVAPYGYGKSTLLRLYGTGHLAATDFCPEIARERILPVYLPANELAHAFETRGSLWDSIAFTVRELYGLDGESVINSCAGHHTLLLLIDGFDEIDSLSTLSPGFTRREQARNLARQLLRTCLRRKAPSNFKFRFVFGGRDQFFDRPEIIQDLVNAKCCVVRIDGFLETDQDHWLSRWGEVVGGDADSLLTPPELLTNARGRLGMYRSPLILFLHAVAKLGGGDDDAVSARLRYPASIFRRIIDMTIAGKAFVPPSVSRKYWGPVDTLAVPPMTDLLADELRSILREAAHIASKDGGGRRVDTTSLVNHLKENETDFDFLDRWSELPKEVQEARMGEALDQLPYVHFFRQHGMDLEFVHKAFADYLVAERFARRHGWPVDDKTRHEIDSDSDEYQRCVDEGERLTEDQATFLAEIADMDKLALIAVPNQLASILRTKEIQTPEDVDRVRWAIEHTTGTGLIEAYEAGQDVLRRVQNRAELADARRSLKEFLDEFLRHGRTVRDAIWTQSHRLRLADCVGAQFLRVDLVGVELKRPESLQSTLWIEAVWRDSRVRVSMMDSEHRGAHLVGCSLKGPLGHVDFTDRSKIERTSFSLRSSPRTPNLIRFNSCVLDSVRISGKTGRVVISKPRYIDNVNIDRRLTLQLDNVDPELAARIRRF